MWRRDTSPPENIYQQTSQSCFARRQFQPSSSSSRLRHISSGPFSCVLGLAEPDMGVPHRITDSHARHGADLAGTRSRFIWNDTECVESVFDCLICMGSVIGADSRLGACPPILDGTCAGELSLDRWSSHGRWRSGWCERIQSDLSACREGRRLGLLP